MQKRNDNLAEVIDGRRDVYGEPRDIFPRVAEVWSGLLGVKVSATDVPLLLMGYKLVRTSQAPDYSDNSDDIEGYLDIFRELVGPDMVHARSVTEYLDKRYPNHRKPPREAEDYGHGEIISAAREAEDYGHGEIISAAPGVLRR